MVIGVLHSMKVGTKVVTGCFECTGEFCRSNMLQKIKSDRICATCYGDIILLRRQRFSQKFSGTHEVICRCDICVTATCRCN